MDTRRLSFRILVPVVATALTLVLVEGALVLFHPVPPSVEINMYYQPDAHTGYRLQPHGKGHFQGGIEADANSRGHRDDEVEVPKPPGVFRILVLGDSFTVGVNIEQSEMYSEVLERLLGEDSSTPVEVVNAGVGGWAPYQYARYHEHHGRELEPDLVLVGFFVGNDTYVDRHSFEQTMTAVLGRRVSRAAAASPWIELKVSLYQRFNLARLVFNRRGSARDFRREDCGDFSEEFLAVQRERLHTHLRVHPAAGVLGRRNAGHVLNIARRAEQDGARLVVMLLPDETQLNPQLRAEIFGERSDGDYDFDMPQPLLKEWFVGSGVDVIDLLPLFRGDARCLYMNDTHWIPAGHEIAARAIRAWLDAEGLP